VIQHLIWDVDGTLFDTYPAFVRALQAVLPEFGLQMSDAQVLALMKISVVHTFEVLQRAHGIDPNRIGERFWESYDQADLAIQPPFPGVERVLRWVLASGGQNLIVTHRREETTLELLEAHGLVGLVSDVISATAGYPRKPSPVMFEMIVQRNSIPVHQVLSVGDREIDVLASQAAGIPACIFRPVDLPTRAEWVIHHFDELAELLERQGS
jgi:phosphoglycolate phosphatase-like HAD superfamily hydrolase